MSHKSNKSRSGRLTRIEAFIFHLNKYFGLRTIVYLPVLLSVLVLIIGFVLGEQIYQNIEIPPKFVGTIFLIMCLLASVTGFIQIIIREVPGMIFPLKGKVARFIGIVWVMFFWILSVGVIRYYFVLR